MFKVTFVVLAFALPASLASAATYCLSSIGETGKQYVYDFTNLTNNQSGTFTITGGGRISINLQTNSTGYANMDYRGRNGGGSGGLRQMSTNGCNSIN
jgi:hypothetical protein